MDMLGFLRQRAWDVTREQEKKKPRQRFIDEVWPGGEVGITLCCCKYRQSNSIVVINLNLPIRTETVKHYGDPLFGDSQYYIQAVIDKTN